jgi:hypothetical protein
VTQKVSPTGQSNTDEQKGVLVSDCSGGTSMMTCTQSVEITTLSRSVVSVALKQSRWIRGLDGSEREGAEQQRGMTQADHEVHDHAEDQDA